MQALDRKYTNSSFKYVVNQTAGVQVEQYVAFAGHISLYSSHVSAQSSVYKVTPHVVSPQAIQSSETADLLYGTYSYV